MVPFSNTFMDRFQPACVGARVARLSVRNLNLSGRDRGRSTVLDMHKEELKHS